MGISALVIVGAGIMGLSTAVAAKNKYPASVIHLVDFKSPIPPASRDSSRIVRAAYASESYRALAQEALVMWEIDPLYKSFFHKTGWTVVHKGEAMSIPAGATKVPTEKFREMWPRAKLDGDETITEDGDLGWAEANNAIDAILDHARSIGVIYHDGEAFGLHWEELVCTGVQLKNGNFLKGSVLLAMGHSTPHFLELCGKPLAGGVIQIAGVSVMEVKLNEKHYQMYKDNGILLFPGKGEFPLFSKYDVYLTKSGEILPPRSDRILKINNARSFSIPKLPLPEYLAYPEADAPIFRENVELLSWYDPELKSAEVVSKRFCL